MISQFGVKDLYEVSFKTTDNIEINNKSYEQDEVFLYFKNLQISNISGESVTSEARGGRNNFPLLLWDSVKSLDFVFEGGLINMNSINLLSQSKSFFSEAQTITIPRREYLISNSSGIITTDFVPNTGRRIFVYKLLGDIIQEKIDIVSVNNSDVNLGTANANTSVLIDYYFEDDQVKYYNIGGENIKGFFKMTSKISFTDEKDGVKTTMLFVMPKVKILSNINLTLGIKANPVVSTFRARALVGDGDPTLARFIYLNQDIEG